MHVAKQAIVSGFDAVVEPGLRRFFYMPFMHAEDKEEQGYSLRLIEPLGDPGTLVWASHHQHVVARFGRFPHRNALLGRSTTLEEQAFLETSDFRG